MWLESSTKLLRNLRRYERRKNKKPKIKVQYIQFSNKSIPRKESGVLRGNRGITGRRRQYGRRRLLMWLVAAGLVASVFLYGYFHL